MRWYAYRTFHNRQRSVAEIAEKAGCKVFVQKLVPSLLFIKSTEEFMQKLRRNHYDSVAVYYKPGTNEPAVIPDNEMNTFIFIVSTGCETLEAIDEKLIKGDKVRVTEGVFKGSEGYIVRVHGTKRFVVLLEGIVAMSTTYIPRTHLEKVISQDNGQE